MSQTIRVKYSDYGKYGKIAQGQLDKIWTQKDYFWQYYNRSDTFWFVMLRWERSLLFGLEVSQSL